jgi:hypothetical protein
MQAITTKSIGPTNTKGARIQARMGDIRVSVPYRLDLSGEAVHFEAVKKLCEKQGYKGRALECGFANDGYVFVFVGSQSRFNV